MIYRDIEVNVPKEALIYHGGYVYITKEKIYRKDMRYNVNERVAIGKLKSNDDKTIMHPNDNARLYYPSWFEKERVSTQADMRSLGSHLVIDKLLKETEIGILLDEIFPLRSNHIKDLIQYMIIYETTIAQHFAKAMWTIPLFKGELFSDSTISRIYQDIAYKDIDLFLRSYNALKKKGEIYLSYDSTNILTYSKGLKIAELGHPKEREQRLPQVNIAYAFDQRSEDLLFYSLYNGSINDKSEVAFGIDMAHDYGYKDITLILDRGYYSYDNLKRLELRGFGLIAMMSNDLDLIKDIIEKVRLKVANTPSAYLKDQRIYGLTEIEKVHGKTYYFHIFYDGNKANIERTNLLDHYLTLEESLKTKIAKSKLIKKEDLKRYEKTFRFRFDKSGYLISYRRNDKKIQDELKDLGYFVIMSSKKMEADEVLEIYRDRDSIEKIFFALKNEIGFDRLHSQSRQTLEAKVFITFLATALRSMIYTKTKELRKKDRKAYTIPAIIGELNKIDVYKDAGGKFIRRYPLTKKQKDILSLFNITTKDVDRYLDTINKTTNTKTS